MKILDEEQPAESIMSYLVIYLAPPGAISPSMFTRFRTQGISELISCKLCLNMHRKFERNGSLQYYHKT